MDNTTRTETRIKTRKMRALTGAQLQALAGHVEGPWLNLGRPDVSEQTIAAAQQDEFSEPTRPIDCASLCAAVDAEVARG